MSLIPLLLSPLAPAPPAGEHAAAWLSPPRSPSATNGNAGTRRPRRRTSGQPATRPPRHSGRRGARPSWPVHRIVFDDRAALQRASDVAIPPEHALILAEQALVRIVLEMAAADVQRFLQADRLAVALAAQDFLDGRD